MPRGGERLQGRETSLAATLGVAVVAFAAWRVTIGADLGDGSHVVALAMRMAQGDRPLADEMNLQVLGSLTAVPFTWAWLQVAGVDGIVLAVRLWYLCVALGSAALAYRALRTVAPALPALTGVVFMLLPTPYNLLVTSYNTVPVLALGVATCSAFAALRGDDERHGGRWAAVSGVALALAVISHPTTIAAAVALAVAILVRARGSRAARRGLLAGGGAVSVVAVLAVLVSVGPGAVRRTVEYTLAYQSERPDPLERLGRALTLYGEALFVPVHLPAAALAVLAAAAPRRWRAAAGLAVVFAVALAVLATVLDAPKTVSPFGSISPAFGLLVIAFLLPPVLVWTICDDDLDMAVLLSLTVPTALVGFALMTMASSASAHWGPAAASFLPLVGVLAYAVAAQAGERVGVAAAVASLLILVLLGTHTLRTFRDPSPPQLDERIATGPQLGLLTQESLVARSCALEEVTAGAIGPDESVLFYGVPAGYVYSEARMDTNILWLSSFGAANSATVEWMRDTARRPDVVIVGVGTVQAAGGWDRLVTEDPFIAMVDENYGPAARAGAYLVHRRDGTRAEVATRACSSAVR